MMDVVTSDGGGAESALGGSPERAFSKESVRVHNPCVGFKFEETTLNLNDTF